MMNIDALLCSGDNAAVRLFCPAGQACFKLTAAVSGTPC